MTGNFDSDCIQIEFPYELNSTGVPPELALLAVLKNVCLKLRGGLASRGSGM